MITYSAIKKSQLEGAHRLDAEYYCAPDNIKNDFLYGRDVVDYVQYGTSKELNENKAGYPVLRLNEYEEYFISKPGKYCNKINENTYKQLKLKKKDVLICRTNGNPDLVGRAAIVMEDTNYAFASYLFRIRTKETLVKPAFIVVYLNSRAGRCQIEKYLMPSIQSNFSPAKFAEIKIPTLPLAFQKKIEELVKTAYALMQKSKSLYSQAENLLLEELGLDEFKIKSEIANVVNLSEVKETGRMDAEYFQAKYEILIARLKECRAKPLRELVSMKKGFEPGSEAYQEEGKVFIRVSSLSKHGIDEKDQKYLADETYRKLRGDYEPKVGEILLTKDATPGTAYYLKEQIEGVISSGIMRLKIIDKKNVAPEYLAICINSLIGQMQVERDAGGSIIMHWKPKQILELLIPLLPIGKQRKIADLVRRSHEARKKSKELLEEAKRKVEEMIDREAVND
ncbi:MAG: restriction endonuclease subunit S [Candidatus Margulisiibacteriota bacterium]